MTYENANVLCAGYQFLSKIIASLFVHGTSIIRLMLGANVVVEYQLEEALGNHCCVAERHNFDMRELVAAPVFAAYNLGASEGHLAACLHDSVVVGDVVEQVLLESRRHPSHRHRSRRNQQVQERSSMPKSVSQYKSNWDMSRT